MTKKNFLALILATIAFFVGLFMIIIIAGTASILLSHIAINIIGQETENWKVVIAVITSATIMIICVKPTMWVSKKWANWVNSIC